MLVKVAVALVLFIPSTSAGEPKREDVERVRYDTRRPTEPRAQPGDWIELAGATPARHGSEHIVLDPKKVGPLGRLRVDATGRVIVRRIKVFFVDGTRKTVTIDKTLSPGRASTLVDLKYAGPVDYIVVDTEPQTRGSYTLSGASNEPSVAKR